MDVDETFRTVCRIVLQSEIGQFEEFEELLKRYVGPLKESKSIISGEPVYYSEPYSKEAKFISLDESNKIGFEPLKIDEIKDIDSLFTAVQERFHYAGNKILGTSQDVEKGENCVDSFHIHKSREIFNSEHMIHSQMILDSKYLVGCAWGAESNFCLNCTEIYRINRCFEATFIANSSDAYFSYNCKNCNEIMFCFNQFSKRYSIGNNQIPKDKYLELKKKILNELVEELKSKKKVPSLVEFSSGGFQQ